MAAVCWNPAWRIIPTRYPATSLFDRVASAADFEALYALEALTNDRLRNELGQIALVPATERLFGPGSGPIMAAFTHLNPQGSRFSDGRYGVFYCAREEATAIAETVHHSQKFLAATSEPPMRLAMRLYSVKVAGEVADLRGLPHAGSALFDADTYVASRAAGNTIRSGGHTGIVYPSVRHRGGECVAAFRTSLLRNCYHAAYMEYRWNGKAIDSAFKLTQVFGMQSGNPFDQTGAG